MTKLLDKAKLAEKIVKPLWVDAKFNEQELTKLAMAWMTGEITHAQASRATKRAGSAVYWLLAVSLKCAFEGALSASESRYGYQEVPPLLHQRRPDGGPYPADA